ncbi:MAG: DUF2064 domain-containing protein [Anaerolineales bacterium]|nr:DUF2064 domain-containing protein [Anaerolineales bacterium]
MNRKKHAFLLFTKAPMAGKTKTRLTKERGGIFTPEEALDFYKACLLDVTEIGFRAIEELNQANASENGDQPDQYDFFISYSPASEKEAFEKLFKEAGPWPASIHFIIDHGENFDQHFDDAFKQLFDRGYHAVVSIGGDLPTMPVNHIVQAFQWLAYFDAVSDKGGFVQAPCQACGVSLVGYTAQTAMDSQGVFYNLQGVPALDAYTHKASQQSIPTAMLMPVADVDNGEDLAHTISLIRSIKYASYFQPDLFVPHRTLAWIDRMGLTISTPPNTEHDPRESIDA